MIFESYRQSNVDLTRLMIKMNDMASCGNSTWSSRFTHFEPFSSFEKDILCSFTKSRLDWRLWWRNNFSGHSSLEWFVCFDCCDLYKLAKNALLKVLMKEGSHIPCISNIKSHIWSVSPCRKKSPISFICLIHHGPWHAGHKILRILKYFQLFQQHFTSYRTFPQKKIFWEVYQKNNSIL